MVLNRLARGHVQGSLGHASRVSSRAGCAGRMRGPGKQTQALRKPQCGDGSLRAPPSPGTASSLAGSRMGEKVSGVRHGRCSDAPWSGAAFWTPCPALPVPPGQQLVPGCRWAPARASAASNTSPTPNLTAGGRPGPPSRHKSPDRLSCPTHLCDDRGFRGGRVMREVAQRPRSRPGARVPSPSWPEPLQPPPLIHRAGSGASRGAWCRACHGSQP